MENGYLDWRWFVRPGDTVFDVGANVGVWSAKVMTVLVAVMSGLAIISYTRLGLSFIAQEQKPLEETHRKS